MNKTILVAGAGGYLGTVLVDKLLLEGYSVVALDRFYFGDVYHSYGTKNKLKVIKLDVRSVPDKYLKDVWAVINLAAISNDPASELDPKLTQDINYLGAVNLAKQAQRLGVSRYIFASSCSVYGHSEDLLIETSKLSPVSEYARSKIRAEKEILELKGKHFCPIVLRMGTLHGLSPKRMRFDLIVNIMTLHAWKNNKIHIMGGGKQWRPLLHVEDAAQAYILVLKHTKLEQICGEIFNVGSEEANYQVYQIASLFKEFFPSVQIEDTPDDPDKRNYRVSFKKILDTLDYRTKYGVKDSIRSIKQALEVGAVKDELRTRTVNYYQYLLEANKDMDRIKIDGKIF